MNATVTRPVHDLKGGDLVELDGEFRGVWDTIVYPDGSALVLTGIQGDEGVFFASGETLVVTA